MPRPVARWLSGLPPSERAAPSTPSAQLASAPPGSTRQKGPLVSAAAI